MCIDWNAKNLEMMPEEEFDKEFNDYCAYADNLTTGLGTVLINVFNTNLEENTILSPFHYIFTNFGAYIKGEMTQEEVTEYSKNTIQAILTVYGAAKAGKWAINKVNASAEAAVNTLDEISVIDDVPQNIGDDIARETIDDEVTKEATKVINEQMLETQNADLWGILPDGTNQGVKHFADYWEKYPDRIPSLEERLGANAGDFANTVDGFNNFTNQAQNVINRATANGTVRQVNDKIIYYVDGVAKAKKGVGVICKDGKIQPMMPSDIKSFNKLQ